MSSTNSFIRLLTLAVLSTPKSESKPSNRWPTIGSYMIGLFMFSVIGTIIVYFMLEDKAVYEDSIVKAMLRGLENCVGADYRFLLKPLVEGLMMTGNSLSALIFLGFSVISFAIILFVLSRLKTKIPESISFGEMNTLVFLKTTARLIKDRLFFVESDYSSFANSYLAGNNMDVLKYVYDKHKDGILLKVRDLKESTGKKSVSDELLKAPRNDEGNRVKQAFWKAAYILSFILLTLMYGGLLWMIALAWLPLAVYLIYKKRKARIFGTMKPQVDDRDIEVFFRGVGLQIVEDKKSQGNIESSFLTEEYLEQIEKEISANRNKSYFRLNKIASCQ